ncbi:hypothetical protein CPHO_11890 [Corynebacterium phocae]|uniref:HTH tetR-type domain-containing protein n=1 Tax=Corynebacterium phocae TaxID=161895 RepID=A0A1L7D5N2_9CORY|nr:TetR/AcrR family transcriptional regulator [Corynebacterium phocae]APT93476.1 hypothetical protein CPHO_11890 [Corynebacterium phocae]KAA8721036.1 TetR/AcrR family transcriptional regulator [Corynebacterium phocae]
MTSPRAGKKTGPKPKFTERDVVEAALKVGVADFTLAQVAKELGVATSAVYRLFDGRYDLVRACLEHTARELVLPIPPERSWQEILRDWADRCWELMEKYPGLALTIMQNPSAMLYLDKYFAELAQALEAAGMDRSSVEFALDFIGDTVIATHISISALRGPAGDTAHSEWDVIVEHSDPNSVFSPQESWKGRGFLDAKIDFIITGIERGIPHAVSG